MFDVDKKRFLSYSKDMNIWIIIAIYAAAAILGCAVCIVFRGSRLAKELLFAFCCVPFILAAVCRFSDAGFIIGANALAAAVFALAGTACFAGFFTGLLLYRIIRKKD